MNIYHLTNIGTFPSVWYSLPNIEIFSPFSFVFLLSPTTSPLHPHPPPPTPSPFYTHFILYFIFSSVLMFETIFLSFDTRAQYWNFFSVWHSCPVLELVSVWYLCLVLKLALVSFLCPVLNIFLRARARACVCVCVCYPPPPPFFFFFPPSFFAWCSCPAQKLFQYDTN